MDVGFAEACGGDADKAALFGKFLQRARADIAHTAFQAADELIGEAGERALVSDATFNPFGDGLAALGTFLRIAIGGTSFHGARRAHAAVGLEGAALIKNGFAGGFFGAGKKA